MHAIRATDPQQRLRLWRRVFGSSGGGNRSLPDQRGVIAAGHTRYFAALKSAKKRRNHAGMVPADRRLIKFGARGCVPRFVEKERRPPLRHQGIRSGGNLRVFENLAQTLVAVDAP